MVVASSMDLLDVYMKQVRSILELAVPAWHSGTNVSEKVDTESLQRAALQIRDELYIIQILQLGDFRSQEGFTLYNIW